MSNDLQTSDSERRWWLAVDGRVDGPHPTDHVSSALQSGRLTSASLVCPQGSMQWKPLIAWPALAQLADSISVRPAPPPVRAGSDDRLLTNASLPAMANLICVYALIIVPLYWMFGLAMLLREDNPYLEATGCYVAYGANILFNQIVTLALTVVLAVGGIRLRDLRASGEWLVRLALCVWSVWIIMQIALQLTLLIVGGVTETFDDKSGDVSAWDVFHMFIALAAWCCDIVAVIWLYRQRSVLPLDYRR